MDVLHTSDEARLLAEYAGRDDVGDPGADAGAVVEIGTRHGASARALARGLREFGRAGAVVTIDVDPVPEGAFRGCGPFVIPLRGRSVEIARHWTAPIRLLFVDGDHSAAGLRADLAAWTPFVVPGGVVIVHDHENPQCPDVAPTADAFFSGSGWSVHAAGETSPGGIGKMLIARRLP
jgi:cephalosporin hydroxylase